VIYLAETQFSRFDVYRQIAQNFGLTPFKEAGATASLLSDSGVELLRTSSSGKPRYVHRILVESFSIAIKKD
jgi:hypothetical protein